MGLTPAGTKSRFRVCLRAPRNVVVGTGRVSAHAKRADKGSLRVVEGEAAAEDVHAADLSTDHWVV